MRRHGELPLALLLTFDGLAAICAALSGYALRFSSGAFEVEGAHVPERYAEALPIAVVAMVASVGAAGLYRRNELGRPVRLATAVRVGVYAAVGLATLALLYWKTFQYSRLSIALVGTAFMATFLVGRALAACALERMRRRGRLSRTAILVGGGRPAEALARALSTQPWMGLDVIGTLPHGALPQAFRGARELTDVDSACELLAEGAASEVVIALPAEDAGELGELLIAFAEHTADVRVVPDLGDALLVNPSAAVIGGVPIVSIRERPLYGIRAAAKRALDLVGAAILLVVLAPLLAVLAVLVRLTSPGPALFRQTRTGLDGHEFTMLKFRTMEPDAERETGPVFTSPEDARTTSIGRFLRRFSLDELPQLWNVLRGEMSLVGPRPERGAFIAAFRKRLPGYMVRHSVKAGMTGWAQVHGLRGQSSLEERLRYDLEYIDRWSLWLDIEILGRTAVHVVTGRNAY